MLPVSVNWGVRPPAVVPRIGTRPVQGIPTVRSVEEQVRDGRWQAHDPDYAARITAAFKDEPPP